LKSFVEFDRRPLLIAIAGPNGAGKTTFFNAHLKAAGLRFINADVLADELAIDAYTAAQLADNLRRELVKRRESFIFETVFSDAQEDKVRFLADAAAAGYTVVVCFIGLARPAVSEARVAMRVSQGGHDVPTEKLISRFPRTLSNLRLAIRMLPHVLVYDNTNLASPYRLLATFKNGNMSSHAEKLPQWFRRIIHRQ
jgi:predicted ABC-type ATPase